MNCDIPIGRKEGLQQFNELSEVDTLTVDIVGIFCGCVV